MCGIYEVAVILIISSITMIESKNGELRFVSVVFRHGNRAPHSRQNDMYPNDPYLNDTFYPVGLGGLTNEGKQKMHKLGEELRKRYNDFLGEIYIPEDVEARSTDVPRTKMSLALVLASLYPPTKIQRWNPNLNWQPTLTTYLPLSIDTMLQPSAACPRYVEELDRVISLPEIVKKTEEFRPIMKYLTETTGRVFKDIIDIWFLFHGLMAEVSMNKTLPEWTRDLFPKGPILDAASLMYDIFSYNDEMKKLNGGILLKRIIDDMNATINGDQQRKINLFSAHEMNVAAILEILGLFKPHVPEYSSSVIIELIRRDELHYVKVIRYLGIPPVFEEQVIPDCGELCPFDTFLDLTKKVTPLNETIECMAQFPDRSLSRDLL